MHNLHIAPTDKENLLRDTYDTCFKFNVRQVFIKNNNEVVPGGTIEREHNIRT